MSKNWAELKRTFRLEARLMIERWRSLFFWEGVNSGSEAALSERQKDRNVIKTRIREPASYPDLTIELFHIQGNGELDRLVWEPDRAELTESKLFFFFFVFLLTFVVRVGSISKEIEELIDGSMRTCLQLVQGRGGEKKRDKKVWRKWNRQCML